MHFCAGLGGAVLLYVLLWRNRLLPSKNVQVLPTQRNASSRSCGHVSVCVCLHVRHKVGVLSKQMNESSWVLVYGSFLYASFQAHVKRPKYKSIGNSN